MDITSEAQLRVVLEAKVREAIEKTTTKVLDIFQKKFIIEYAYYNRGKNKRYFDETGEPTWEFYRAWNWTPVQKKIGRIVSELWYNPSGVEHVRDKFKHGSKYSTPEDVTDNMPAILEGKQSSLWMSVPRRGKFWELFITEMIDNNKLKNILSAELKSVGLNVIV